jgi:outer membrane protein TolC
MIYLHRMACRLSQGGAITGRKTLLAVSLLLPVSACMTFSPDGGMTPVADYADAMLQKNVTVIKSEDDSIAAKESVERLRRHALTADTAVQIALLNNRKLQAAYNELAIAEAESVAQSLPPNPTFLISRIANHSAYELEAQVALDILSLATLPARSEIAATRFRQAQLQAIQATLQTAADTRRAYYRAVAANELAALLVQAQATAKSTAELAAKLGETGSLNKLDQAREQVFYAEVTADLANARQQASSARERLARLLGFWGNDLNFKLPGELPALPSRPRNLPAIEVEAVSKRADLQIARIELELMARSLGLTQATRFVSMLDLSGIAKRTKEDGPKIRESGFETQVQIPIFDLGETRVRQAEAAYMQAVNKLADKAIRVRSEARDAYRTYRARYDIAGHYQREILPLRKIITEESQLRFSAMQIDVFALLQEARQRIAALRAAIEARRVFWIADANLQAAILGGGTEESATETSAVASADASSGGH